MDGKEEHLGRPTFVWCPDRAQVWVLRKVVRSDDTAGIVTVIGEDGSEEQFKKAQIHPFDESHSQDLDDVAKANNLHEAPLLDILTRRYDADKIYTFAANVLVSINPYKTLPFLYDLDGPADINAEQLKPHVYTVAEIAFQSMRFPKPTGTNGPVFKDQSIIVSGESGAGKTEASKYVMRYLIAASRDLAHKAHDDNDDLGQYIQDVLLQANTVLEAFGNAKTVRNDNSSRFGKYTMLLYDGNDRIVGGATDHFLLEKSRLVQVSPGERNYHIFYQLCRGVEQHIRWDLRLSNPENFRILNGGNCTTISDDDDEEGEFVKTRSALKVLGVTDEELAELWKLLAFLLHLGNITFQNIEVQDPTQAKVEMFCESIEFDRLAGMQALSADELRETLTIRKSPSVRGEIFVVPLDADECQNNAYALLKWVYGALFSWMVKKVNQSHSNRAENDTAQSFIGILDIFGFEIIRTNSFEQLCINYANEMLQQQFNQHVFVLEQEEYRKEGVDCSVITFKDNQDVIDLISKKPSGLLITLEEHSMLNRKPDNRALLTTYHNTHFDKHPAYSKPRFAGDDFIIRHFAGDVTYTIHNFLEKNNDSLQDQLMRFILSSTSPFLQNIIGVTPMPGQAGFIPERVVIKIGQMASAAADEDEGVELIPAKGREDVRRKKAGATQFAAAITVSYQFRLQLQELMRKLRQTCPHYIKCIKPNNVKAAGSVSRALVMQQLRYSGVLEVVRIRREAYPTREDFKSFYEDFKVLAWGRGWVSPELATNEQARHYVEMLASEVLPGQAFQMGNQRVFLRHYGLDMMRTAVSKFYDEKATIIQAKARAWITRVQFLRLKKIAIKIQATGRMILRRLRYREQQKAIAKLQAFIDGKYKKKQYEQTRAAAIVFQKYQRRHLATRMRNLLKFNRDTAVTVQRYVRGFLARKAYRKMLCAIQMQAYIRMFLAIRRIQRRRKIRKLAVIVQSLVRGFLTRIKVARLRTRLNKAATKIQKVDRGYFQRKRYAVFRAVRLRAIVRMQSVFRRARTRIWYKKMIHHVCILQAWARAMKARSVCMTLKTQQRLKRERENRKAIIIQSYARMWPHRHMFVHKKACACKIESLARMMAQRKHYRETRQSIILAQSVARKYNGRQNYLSTREKVIKMQSMARMYRQRCGYLQTRDKCIKLESFARMILARKRYRNNVRRVILIQSVARILRPKLHLQRERAKAIRVQALVRRYLQRKRYRKAYAAVLRLQRACKRFVLNFQLRKRICALHHNAATGNIRAVEAHLQQHPLDWLIRNKWGQYRTLFQSAILSAELAVVQQLNPAPVDLFKEDIRGNMATHYAADVASLEMLKFFSEIAHPSLFKMRPPRTKTTESKIARDPSEDDDEEEEEKSTRPGMRRGVSLVLRPFAKKKDAEENSDDDEESIAIPELKSSGNTIKTGFLKKRKDESGWQKRWVVLTDDHLLYYRWRTSKNPKKAVPLQGAMVKKSMNIEATFEFYHPSLLGRSNKNGCLYFKAANEAELQLWMTPIRAITGVQNSFQLNKRHLDLSFRRDWLRLTNKDLETPLHRITKYRNSPDQAKRTPATKLVQAATWMLEMGCLPNAQDKNGNTALHYAELTSENEIAICLVHKGSDMTIRNNDGRSPLDDASPEFVAKVASLGRKGVGDRCPLLPPPTKLAGYTYLSIYLERNLMQSTDRLQNPHLSVSVYNNHQHIFESQQDVPCPVMIKNRYLWWAATWHMQTPLENLDEGGCWVVFELKDIRAARPGNRRGSIEVASIAWVAYNIDLRKLESKSINLEMNRPPLDLTPGQEREPADCFLEGDILLSRKMFDVDVRALGKGLEEKDETLEAIEAAYTALKNRRDEDGLGALIKPGSPRRRTGPLALAKAPVKGNNRKVSNLLGR